MSGLEFNYSLNMIGDGIGNKKKTTDKFSDRQLFATNSIEIHAKSEPIL